MAMPRAVRPSFFAETSSFSGGISVSGRAAEIGEVTSKTLQLPEIREERVEQLRAQVQSGNYRPSAENIADALVKETQKSNTPG